MNRRTRLAAVLLLITACLTGTAPSAWAGPADDGPRVHCC